MKTEAMLMLLTKKEEEKQEEERGVWGNKWGGTKRGC
jgi:hypothetical protein